MGAALRFDVLDALRGICALLVALYHFNSNGYLASLPVVQNGWLFVDYFFVLSGFVIAHSYGERLATRQVSVGKFMGLRMGRIYPLHIAVLFAFIALEMVLIFGGDTIARYVSREPFTGSRSLEALGQNIFLLQSFGIPGGAGWNGPAWSIAAEIWTYLLFALVFLVPKRFMLGLAALLAAGAAIGLMSYAKDLHVTFDGGILRCIFGFGIGVLTYHAFRRFGGVGGTGWELAALALTVAYVSVAELMLTFVAPLVFGAMIFVLASQRGVVAKVLSMSGFQKLGLISYSIYMVHIFLQGRLGEVLQITRLVDLSVDKDGRTLLQGSPLMADAITIVMLVLLVIASFISYYLVEKPGRDLSRKWLSGPKPVKPAQETA
ncbi:MAG: acyltransferase [Pseudomonadota bacterium]